MFTTTINLMSAELDQDFPTLEQIIASYPTAQITEVIPSVYESLDYTITAPTAQILESIANDLLIDPADLTITTL